MLRFYSHGKLLLTAEYVVLDGAKALALPTKYGQSLTVKTIEPLKLIWIVISYKLRNLSIRDVKYIFKPNFSFVINTFPN